MFAQEAERLRRKTWKDTNELAEELYAILSNNDLPLEHSGPVTLNQPEDGTPPLTLKGSEGGDTVINITPAGLPDSNITINNAGTPQFPGNSNTTNVTNVTNVQGQNAFVGTVSAGSGKTYTVALFGGRTVRATCLGVDSSETVPSGTEVVVLQVGPVFYFQVPVWL